MCFTFRYNRVYPNNDSTRNQIWYMFDLLVLLISIYLINQREKIGVKNQTIIINEINNPEESLTLELSPKKVPSTELNQR